MKKLLLIAILLPFFQFALAQEEIVKWTFPNNLLSDTVQNGTNPLNSTSTLRIEGAGPITMTNGATTKAATATNWTDGMDVKYWYINFKSVGYEQVKISFKQSAGGTNGGPRDFKLQYRIGNSGLWADVQGGTVILANNWTTAVINNLALPVECQNQSDNVYVRWIMTSNTDVSFPAITTAGVSKIDDIIVTGMLITGLADQKEAKGLSTFPIPSTSAFSIEMTRETSLIEIYNINGQLVFKTIPDNDILPVEKPLPAGLYFIKATQDGKTKIIKHIVK